jgi:hypothetical protein
MDLGGFMLRSYKVLASQIRCSGTRPLVRRPDAGSSPDIELDPDWLTPISGPLTSQAHMGVRHDMGRHGCLTYLKSNIFRGNTIGSKSLNRKSLEGTLQNPTAHPTTYMTVQFVAGLSVYLYL